MKNGLVFIIMILALGAGFLVHALLVKNPAGEAGTMTPEMLNEIITANASEVKDDGRVWEFQVSGVAMACIIDPNHDRMRIIAPILEADKLLEKHRKIMLESNYHNALDARYATSNGIVYSVFIHPFSSLDEKQLKSAMRQVSELAKTFGTTYSSGELSFGAQGTDL